MTSNPTQTDFGFTINSSDLDGGTLNHPGQVRVDKIYTLSQAIVVKTFGRVNEETLRRIRDMLQDLAGKKP
jgi:mRNA interferase MazF